MPGHPGELWRTLPRRRRLPPVDTGERRNSYGKESDDEERDDDEENDDDKDSDADEDDQDDQDEDESDSDSDGDDGEDDDGEEEDEEDGQEEDVGTGVVEGANSNVKNNFAYVDSSIRKCVWDWARPKSGTKLGAVVRKPWAMAKLGALISKDDVEQSVAIAAHGQHGQRSNDELEIYYNWHVGKNQQVLRRIRTFLKGGFEDSEHEAIERVTGCPGTRILLLQHRHPAEPNKVTPCAAVVFTFLKKTQQQQQQAQQQAYWSVCGLPFLCFQCGWKQPPRLPEVHYVQRFWVWEVLVEACALLVHH